ncbi:lysozyme inhibitor LprI family protein [uncultured Halopseudomonas sp.]|uniref:lysozyme inhibitor LprI family protein n=1 Tax=uncultured Halopseudomonas sp. TaxID=2901193 RepID=UPI0030ED9FBC
MKTTFFAIVFTAFAPFSYAADRFCDTGRIHPVDAQLEQEMDQNGGTTVDMREAQSRAHAGWDEELNSVYRELMAILPPQEQLLLRDAQRSWLSFRDTEAEFWWSQSISGGGSLQPIIVTGYGIELLKARVCQLTKYKNAATPI